MAAMRTVDVQGERLRVVTMTKILLGIATSYDHDAYGVGHLHLDLAELGEA
jgi:hypothetical protein